MSRSGLVLVLLGAVGCGPPGLGPLADDDSDGETSTSTSDTPTTTSSPEPTTSSPEPTTSDETTSDESSDGTLTFVPANSDIMGCECDPFAQDCPEGEKCVAYASTGQYWDANLCVPMTGSQPAGEPCSYAGPVEATDDCDATSACWDVEEIDGEWTGVCHSFCEGTPDDPECPAESTCLIANEGSVTLCIVGCDPLAQAQDCSDGSGCYWTGIGFECAPSATNIPAGQPCDFINDCAPGLICTGFDSLPSCDGANCCTPFCDILLGDGQCEGVPGTSCVPFYEEGEAPIGADNLGLCIVP